MKKLYKVILALAISLGCASAFAEGTAVVSTDAPDGAKAIEISSFGNTVTVGNADGQTVKVYSLLGGNLVTSAVVTDGQITVDAPTGAYIVVTKGASQTVIITE